MIYPRPDLPETEIDIEFGATHSSSQRLSDTIGNTPPPSCQSSLVTPAGPPPPAGVTVCARRAGKSFPSAQNLHNKARFMVNPCTMRMGGIPIERFRARARRCIHYPSVGQRTPPPSVPRQDWRPLLLPGCQSRSATPAGPPPPAGVAFCAASTLRRITILTFVANRSDFSLNSASLFA